MVDIPGGQIGAIVKCRVEVLLREDVVSAIIHHLQVLIRKIAHTWGQLRKRKDAIWSLAMVGVYNAKIFTTESCCNLHAKKINFVY